MNNKTEIPRIGVREFLNQKEVIKRLGISRSTFLTMLKKEEFAKPIRMSVRVHVWKDTDVDNFIEQKIKERDQKND
jgi:predicted DNA-binding transcriptional regulator AlpA